MTAPFFKSYFISFVVVVAVVVLNDLRPYLDCKAFSINDHFFL